MIGAPTNPLETSSIIGIETILPAYLCRMVTSHRRRTTSIGGGGDNGDDDGGGGGAEDDGMETDDDGGKKLEASAAGGGGGGAGQGGAAMDAPTVLDVLCATPSSGRTLLPHRAAAVAAAIGELEDLSPGALRDCVAPPAPNASSPTGNASADTDAVDRVTSLAHAMLEALRTLTVRTSELDCLPSLAYQLCLLPSRVAKSGGGDLGGAGTAGVGGVGGMARTSSAAIDLRVGVLAGLADVFDALRERVDEVASGAAAVAGGNTGRAGPRGIDAEAVRWAVGTSLSHVGTNFWSMCMYCVLVWWRQACWN